MTLDAETCFRAFSSRDRRFEGRFVTAVTTTGIYCRPGCPAPLPRRRNIRFYACPAAAEEAGFRPCLRCRPDAVPGTPAWIGTSATVNRALRLIEEGALDGAGLEPLAERLGVTSRHLRRLFAQHLGASPLAVARTRRLHFARRLIDGSRLPLGEVALSAGFSNVRRFNHAIRETFCRTPRELRRSAGNPVPGARRAVRGARDTRIVSRPSPREALKLTLRARLPFDGNALLAFLAPRAVPGLESVTNGVYRRAIEVEGTRGTIAVTPREEALDVAVRLSVPRDLIRVAARVTRVFDLDADPGHILAQLRRDALLERALTGRRDLRVPGAWDPFELCVRAILGQQISVRGAATLAGRIVSAYGQPLDAPEDGVTHVFPTPAKLARAALERLGLTRARAAALRSFAGTVADGTLRLDQLGELDRAVARLCEQPGIGEWTANYIAMRGLGEPDAFPAGDLGIAHALAESRERKKWTPAAIAVRAEAWRPWRAYAVMALWTRKPDKDSKPSPRKQRSQP